MLPQPKAARSHGTCPRPLGPSVGGRGLISAAESDLISSSIEPPSEVEPPSRLHLERSHLAQQLVVFFLQLRHQLRHPLRRPLRR